MANPFELLQLLDIHPRPWRSALHRLAFGILAIVTIVAGTWLWWTGALPLA